MAFNLELRTSITGFLNERIKDLTQQLEQRELFIQPHKSRSDKKRPVDKSDRAANKSAEKEFVWYKDELFTIFREKKFIIDDVVAAVSIKDPLPNHEIIKEAYTTIILQKIQSTLLRQTYLHRQQPRFNRDAFSYYSAIREPQTESAEIYCHLMGWRNGSGIVMAANIVPKSLESTALSYLFGVYDAELSEPRNMITLCGGVKDDWDYGHIMFVPEYSKESGTIVWRCRLADQEWGNRSLGQYETGWRHYEGKELKFLTPNRPAHRYLYFRFMLTYLLRKYSGGSLHLIEGIEWNALSWGTPGGAVRKSMLVALAMQFGDDKLPAGLCDETTFISTEESPAVSEVAEAEMACMLKYKVTKYFRQIMWRGGNDLESSEDSESSDDGNPLWIRY